MNKNEAIEFFKEAVAHNDPVERKKSYEAQNQKDVYELDYEARHLRLYDGSQTLLQIFMKGRLTLSYHISRDEITELKKHFLSF